MGADEGTHQRFLGLGLMNVVNIVNVICNMPLSSPMSVTRLECAVAKIASVSPLQSALSPFLWLKSPRISTYVKTIGGWGCRLSAAFSAAAAVIPQAHSGEAPAVAA